jgi:hypothetical protein
MTLRTLILGVLVVAAVGLGLWYVVLGHTPSPDTAQPLVGATTTVPVPQTSSKPVQSGVIAQGDGTSTYFVPKYGFKFSFPSSWRTGSGDLNATGPNDSFEYFQLFNYSSDEVKNPEAFRKGHIKIEGGIAAEQGVVKTSKSLDPNLDLNDNPAVEKRMIAGKLVYRIYNTDYGYISYAVAIPEQSRYLSFTVYGAGDGNDILAMPAIETIVGSLSAL